MKPKSAIFKFGADLVVIDRELDGSNLLTSVLFTLLHNILSGPSNINLCCLIKLVQKIIV